MSGLSPFLRSAATYLPLAVLAGCKATPAAVKAAPAGGAYKLLSYLTFPAISLFVLLGATIFSIAKIRGIRERSAAELADQQAIHEATRQWWCQHKWAAVGVFAATMLLAVIRATWLLFLFYIVSFGILLFVLASYATLGLGNRQMIGQSCQLGLMFLGSMASFSGVGIQEIHFVDQMLVAAVFWGGCLVLLPFVLTNSPNVRASAQSIAREDQLTGAVIVVLLLVALIGWIMHPMLWPVTQTRIKHYVESFDQAPFSTVSWQHWEIAAQWAIDTKLDPDLSKPRQLLAREIAGKQNSLILSDAMRAGLLQPDQLASLKNYHEHRRFLVDFPPGLEPQVITSLNQFDWVIRAAVLRNELSSQERDRLEQRLHATMEHLFEDPYAVLCDPLRVTQLLEVLDRPINRVQYREQMKNLLRKFHTKNTGGFQLAGGFKSYLTWPAGSWISQPGSLESTAYAVELMEIYGVPDDLDLNWVRSFLKPTVLRFSDDKWVAASTLDRLNHLPGVKLPTSLEWLYYERSLLAAAVLVGLCLYATLLSPKLKSIDPTDGSSPPDRPDIDASQASG